MKSVGYLKAFMSRWTVLKRRLAGYYVCDYHRMGALGAILDYLDTGRRLVIVLSTSGDVDGDIQTCQLDVAMISRRILVWPTRTRAIEQGRRTSKVHRERGFTHGSGGFVLASIICVVPSTRTWPVLSPTRTGRQKILKKAMFDLCDCFNSLAYEIRS